MALSAVVMVLAWAVPLQVAPLAVRNVLGLGATLLGVVIIGKYWWKLSRRPLIIFLLANFLMTFLEFYPSLLTYH